MNNGSHKGYINALKTYQSVKNKLIQSIHTHTHTHKD